MSRQEKPAALLGVGRVVLTQRGVEMCLAALLLAVRQGEGRNGGVSTSGEFVHLRDVLRLAAAEQVPQEPAPQEAAVPGTAPVAAAGTAGAASQVEGLGRLDTRTVAERLGISERAIRKACSKGTLRAVRVAGHWEIEEADAVAYGERRKAVDDDGQTAAFR